MKIFSFLFQLVFFSQVIFGEDLLSKFHQQGYKLKDFRMEPISFDQNYFNIFELKTFKYNRTTAAINITLNYKVNVRDKLEFLIQGYKLLSNQYRVFPMRFQINGAKTFKANVGGTANMAKCGNLKNGFVFSKDVTYKICNFVIDDEHLPPLIPNGRYQFKVQILYLENNIATLHMFCEVYTPRKY